MFGVALLLVAVVLVLHAAFSTYEHLSHLKALGQSDESSLPNDIVTEALVGLVVGILGASLKTPPLKEITWASEMKTRNITDMNTRLSFANYNNRGRNLFAAAAPTQKKSL